MFYITKVILNNFVVISERESFKGNIMETLRNGLEHISCGLS